MSKLNKNSVLSDPAVLDRVNSILSKLTIDAKVGQLLQLSGADFFPGPKTEDVIRKYGAGSILWLNDTKKFNYFQKIAVEESPAGIPILFGLDVIHGYRTIFPQPLAMASSWDPEVAEKAQSVAAKEARAAGIHWTFGPMLDIARDARWGRIVEGAGEDPYLGSAMAAAHVRGFQGEKLSSDPDKMVACAKHFAGYATAEGGRDYDSVFVSETQMRNVIFPPFQAAVKAGVGSFMGAYTDINNVPASGNHWLLTEILRDEWGFDGFVVSDAMAIGNMVIQGHARDKRDAALRALKAGMNMDMASGSYLENLVELVKEGVISEKEIDAMVRPILAVKVVMGLFEHPYTDETLLDKVVALPEHRRLSRWAAQRSMVLLRNECGMLPLSKDQKSVAVIGPLADSSEGTEGSWMVFGHKTGAVTVLEGIKAKLPTAKITYAPGPQIHRTHNVSMDEGFSGIKKPVQSEEEAEAAFQTAIQTAKEADLVVMVLGENADMAGEFASRGSLDLPGRQAELLKSVSALGKPVVLVLMNGRPLSVNWAAENVSAILEAWEPGTEGGNAIADILFGDANPGGKLPVCFPRSGNNAPMYYARNLSHLPESEKMYQSRYWDGPTTPLYPFGYGLSYTSFSFANLKLSEAKIKKGQSFTVSVEVTNSGKVAGDEVVQLYIHQKWGTDTRPMRELKGFKRITLQPGETQKVTFQLGPDELRYWSTILKDWIQDSASFDVWVGEDSCAELHTEFEVAD
jgi:beta-glucosidase